MVYWWNAYSLERSCAHCAHVKNFKIAAENHTAHCAMIKCHKEARGQSMHYHCYIMHQCCHAIMRAAVMNANPGTNYTHMCAQSRPGNDLPIDTDAILICCLHSLFVPVSNINTLHACRNYTRRLRPGNEIVIQLGVSPCNMLYVRRCWYFPGECPCMR